MSAPRITVVIPAPQGAAGVEESLRSITKQGYEGAEVRVIEGGGEKADRYAMVHAGFARSSGEVLGFLAPGEAHLDWTLRAVSEIFARYPEVAWIGSLRPAFVNEEGVCVHVGEIPGYSREAFLDGRLVDEAIPEAGTFFRRSLWERAGGRFPASGEHAALSLWARFFEHEPLVGVDIPLAVSRARPEDPARRVAIMCALADLAHAAHHRPSPARAALTLLRLGRFPRVGAPAEARWGYRGRRLSRPDRGPDAGRFVLEEHAFS